MDRPQIAVVSSLCTLVVVGVFLHLNKPGQSDLPLNTEPDSDWMPDIIKFARSVFDMCTGHCQAQLAQTRAMERNYQALRAIEVQLDTLNASLSFVIFVGLIGGGLWLAWRFVLSRDKSRPDS